METDNKPSHIISLSTYIFLMHTYNTALAYSIIQIIFFFTSDQ